MSNPNQNTRGKVLRVKSGYNPNSSSVGTHLPHFLFFAAASGTLTVIVLQILDAYDRRMKKKNNPDQDSTS